MSILIKAFLRDRFLACHHMLLFLVPFHCKKLSCSYKPVQHSINTFFNRQEKATLLGFENYAFLSLDSKMADSPSEVWEMISNLKDKSKTAAQTELITVQVKINCYFITEWYCLVIIYHSKFFSDIWIGREGERKEGLIGRYLHE